MTATPSGIIVSLHPAISVLVAASMMALQPLRESYQLLFSLTTMEVTVEYINMAFPICLMFSGIKTEFNFFV